MDGQPVTHSNHSRNEMKGEDSPIVSPLENICPQYTLLRPSPARSDYDSLSPPTSVSSPPDMSMSEDDESEDNYTHQQSHREVPVFRNMRASNYLARNGAKSNARPSPSPLAGTDWPISSPFRVDKVDDAGPLYGHGADGCITEDDDQDDFIPSPADDDDEDWEIPLRNIVKRTHSSPSSRKPGTKKRPASKKRASKTKTKQLRAQLVLIDDESDDEGMLLCGLIVEAIGKPGRYTAKGMEIPEVGQVCGMRCRSHEMIRHQTTAKWHRCPKAPCPFCAKLLVARPDNCDLHRQLSGKPSKGERQGAKVFKEGHQKVQNLQVNMTQFDASLHESMASQQAFSRSWRSNDRSLPKQ